MKNNFKIILTLFILLAYGCSSDKELDELGTDPNNPEAVTPTLLISSAQVSVLGGYGYNWDRYANTFVQTFAGNHATGVNADQFNLRNSDFQTAYSTFYQKGLKDCYEVINNQGPNVGAWHHVGVAKIIMATGLGYLTDIYGDIPYTEAFNVTEFKNPAFDSQESIYQVINTLLTEAVADLNQTADLELAGDMVHGNDVSKWKATAYLMLAKYSNNLSKIDPLGSATAALAYVDLAKAEGLTDNSWNYSMKFSDSDPNWRNPWYELYTNNLIIASSNFMDLLISSDYGSWDPRLFSYWNTTAFGGTDVDFSGKDNGLPTGNESFSPVGPQGYYGKVDSDLLIATHFELLFIEAEAAFRSGNTTRAATALGEAISSQVNLVSNAGVPHVESYFDVDNATAQGIIDSRVTAYINYNSFSSTTITEEQIMVEKYKAMFCQGISSFTDARRHDFQYPSYLALPQNSFLSSFIRRGLYPQTEVENNSSTPSGVTMTDRLWWDN